MVFCAKLRPWEKEWVPEKEIKGIWIEVPDKLETPNYGSLQTSKSCCFHLIRF